MTRPFRLSVELEARLSDTDRLRAEQYTSMERIGEGYESVARALDESDERILAYIEDDEDNLAHHIETAISFAARG